MIRNFTRKLFPFLLFVFFTSSLCGQTHAPLRRVISPQQPMWLIHVDTWNYADPQKIIDMIPVDIRPYVVMNLSFSISHNETTGAFNVVEYGLETARSWMRTCAENRMWAMIQPASGGFSHFSDFDLSVYNDFYREYPNFIGFNYCEQFWGFDDKFSVSWTQRINLFTNLMKLNQKYGGYLVVSWCGAYYGASINPIAMMKRNPNFAAVCKQDPEHFILCEKFTSAYGFSDIESTCLGTWLSGYSGQYGIRFDQCGWVPTDTIGEKTFPPSAGAAPVLEHLLLTGETVVDGPELIWQQCFKNLSNSTTSDGLSMRRWDYFPQFRNISMDIFRKVVDGTIPILSRKEVLDRTKVVIVNDVTTGNDQNKYSSPDNLFEGLYRMDGEGPMMSNVSWFKKTGRYPAVPTVFQLADSLANTFPVKINKSAYPTRWPTTASKVSDFNTLFPQEYTGDLYAARQDNGWITYNPKKTGMSQKLTFAKGVIPFKYNTCDRMELSYGQYTAGIIREFADKLTFYLTNYDNVNTTRKNDTIRIYGSTAEPTYTWNDRALHQASTLTKTWADGVFMLVVTHNGPLDLTINCAGTATGRLTAYRTASLIPPAKPDLYTGPRQYEVENFDTKSVGSVLTSGVNSGIKNYTGQGFLKFGTNSAAIIRDSIYALKSGNYRIKIRYVAPTSSLSLQMKINGAKKTVTFIKTAGESDWTYNVQSVSLKAGVNVLQFLSLGSTYPIHFDHIVLERDDNDSYSFSNDVATTSATTPAAENLTVLSGAAGVMAYTNALGIADNAFRAYSAGNLHKTGLAHLEMLPQAASNYSVVWKEFHQTAGGKKGMLMRAIGISSYAEGMRKGYLFIAKNNADESVTLKTYVVGSDGLTEKTSFTTSFMVSPGQPLWLRASAIGNKLTYECSKDSSTWSGATATAFTDNAYAVGSTALVWGLDSDSLNWVVDNIAAKIGVLSASMPAIDGFTYVSGNGPSVPKPVYLTGKDLFDVVTVQAPSGYEIATDSDGEFKPNLVLAPQAGALNAQPVFIRLRANMTVGICYGDLKIGTANQDTIVVRLNGNISARLQYTFNNDVASTFAQSPPAANVSVGVGNGTTAGVATTPGSGDKALRVYSGGDRNGTGVLNLSMFPSAATEYSVTWKYTFGSAATEYKVGLLLRGSSPASASTGYTAGLMQGYLFLLNHNTTRTTTEFRIYKPVNSNTSLDRLTTGTMTLTPAVNTPLWMRATVSGSSPVNLKYEYSLDSLTWTTAASTTDTNAPYTMGATQVVWGLAANGYDFFLDNITFTGSTGTLSPVQNVHFGKANVLSTEYFTLSGMKVRGNMEGLKGLFIVREKLSDGTSRSSKVSLR